ncbi:DUF397 domain-containing protein [Catenuloplanes japonicus]|uniref:DUF397 domain-containing protein n=1 Tax=Catenuloplanes japonicus TaxID=33876 RepID=UPI00052530D6|nr:DUF397 domain-containing protein [Catenuloplanes japonicus]
MIDLTGAIWRKSTRSKAAGECVEVAGNLPGAVAIRDSKDPDGSVLVVSAAAFRAFAGSVGGR